MRKTIGNNVGDPCRQHLFYPNPLLSTNSEHDIDYHKINWLSWNGNKKENVFKAKMQALYILHNPDFTDAWLVEKLRNNILRFLHPFKLYEGKNV
jgi:hypothetical protein